MVVLRGGKSPRLFLLSSPLFSSAATMLTNARGQNGFYGDAVAFTESAWYDVPAWMVKRSRVPQEIIWDGSAQCCWLCWPVLDPWPTFTNMSAFFKTDPLVCFITHLTTVKNSLDSPCESWWVRTNAQKQSKTFRFILGDKILANYRPKPKLSGIVI